MGTSDPELTERSAVGRWSPWTVFATAWAISVLFHIAGNPRLGTDWGRLGLGVASIAVLWRPSRPLLSLHLAGWVLAAVWLEAPLLANHWLLSGLIALLVIGAVALARGRSAETYRRFVGPARLTLLAFYGFAAFAKLNADFFDPSVSCGLVYLRESFSSWGAGGPVAVLPRWLELAVPIVVAGIELSIPVLLAVRRTRHLGVLFGLGFHYVLAVDRTHQFFDFSSVLAALFLLFLDDEPLAGIDERRRRISDRLDTRLSSASELLHLAALAFALLVVGIAAGPATWPAPPVLRNVGVVTWLVYGVVLFVAVARSIPRTQASAPLVPAGTAKWLLVIPAIVVLNGFAPYLEVKTGAGWNMYSNLETAAGDSNHFLVRSTFPLTDGNDRLVDIVESTDPALRFYIDGDWLLPEVQLRDHLAGRPAEVVIGVVDGERIRYQGRADDARPVWRQKFQVFRAVTDGESTACQVSFGPAR